MRLHPMMLGVLLALMTHSVRGWGQTQSRADSPSDSEARATELYEQGVTAAKLGEWGRARECFLAAWEIKRHFQIAANLGAAELKLGRYRDAAEHLDYFLREASEIREDERALAIAMLEEARAKAAIDAGPAGAAATAQGTVEAPHREAPAPVQRGTHPTPGPGGRDLGGPSPALVRAGIVTSVVLGAVGTVSTTFSIMKWREKEALERSHDASCTECRQEWDDLQSAQMTTGVIGLASLTAAVALGAGTCIYAFAGSSDATRGAATTDIRIGANGAGLTLSGSF